jgi:hypothetical protein
MLSYHDLEDFMGINDALTDSRVKHHETVTASAHARGDAADDATADEDAGDVPVDVANGWALPRLTTTRPRRGWQGWNGRQGSLRAPLSGPAGRL